MHNAITSINNSLMQSKIILIGVTSSELLFPEHFCNYFEENNAYFSKGSGGALQAPPVLSGVEPWKPRHF